MVDVTFTGGPFREDLLEGGLVRKVGEQFLFDDRPIALVRRPQLVASGVSSVAIDVGLPPNALVEQFRVTARAARAEWTPAANVAKVRQQDMSIASGGEAQTRTRMVLDFGVPRTVSAIGVTDSSVTVFRVKTWSGAGFADRAIYPADGGLGIELRRTVAEPFTSRIDFASEVRTERLQIEMVGALDDAVAGQKILVRLPDVPGDLELRINGGPPAWSFPGTVEPGEAGWSEARSDGLADYVVDLTGVLASLTGDPGGQKAPETTFRLVLSSRVPGVLALERRPADERVSYVAAVTAGFPDGRLELTFAEEGLFSLPLALPAWARKVERVTLAVSASLPPERVMPPVGPDPLTVTVGGVEMPLAEMLLDPDHAACVALTGTHGLVELLGVRLPLRAEPGGAEVRVLLLRPSHGEPGTPLDGSASKPVTLDGPGEVWATFRFPRPVPLDAATLPFVAILVGRGRVAWALTGAVAAGEVWRGAPAGPWQRLPPVALLASSRGRARLLGHASRDAPVPPLQFSLAGAAGAAAEVMPTPKGVVAEIEPADLLDLGGASVVALEVVSRVAGTVTLRDVVAVVTDS